MNTVMRKSISTNSTRFNQKEKTNCKLEESLRKYKEEMEKQEVQMLKAHKEQQDKIRNAILKRREDSINLIKENKEFLKEWESKGRANWSKNMRTFQETKNTDAQFKTTLVKAFKDNITKEKKDRECEESEGIKAFERNLERLGIDINNRKEEGDKKKEQFSIVALMRKIKDKVNVNKLARMEMERRKNKQSVNEENLQREIEKKAEEEKLINRLSKTCENFQKICSYEERNQRCKKIETENRVQKINEADTQYKKKLSALDSVKTVTSESDIKAIKTNLKELQTINRTKKSKKREINTELLKDIVSEILEITDLAFKAQILSPNKQVDSKLMKEWQNKFVIGDALNPAVALSTSTFKQAIIHSMTPKETEDEKLSCYCQFINYLQNLGKWDLQRLMQVGQKGIDVCGYNMELCIIKDHLISPQNIDLKEKLYHLFGTQNIPLSQIRQEELFTPFKIILLGKPKSGKSELAKYISVKYNLYIIDIEEQLTSLAEEAKKQEDELKELANPKNAKQPAKAKAKEEEKQTVECDRLKKIKEEMQKIIKDKKDYSDSHITELILSLVENKMPRKTKSEYYAQYLSLKEKNQQLEKELSDINADPLAKAKNKQAQKRETEIQDELIANKGKLYYGWVLVGYPNSLSQARLLEKAINQRVCDNDAIMDKDFSKDNFDLSLLTYFEHKPKPIALPTYQPNFIYWLIADKKVTDQRFYSSLGHSKSEFEADTKNQNNNEKKVIREAYIAKMRAYDRNYNELIKWMKRYKSQETDGKLLHQVNSNRDIESVHKIIENSLNSQLKYIEDSSKQYAEIKKENEKKTEEGKEKESESKAQDKPKTPIESQKAKEPKKEQKEQKKEQKEAKKQKEEAKEPKEIIEPAKEQPNPKEEAKKEEVKKEEDKKEEAKKIEEDPKKQEEKKEEKAKTVESKIEKQKNIMTLESIAIKQI